MADRMMAPEPFGWLVRGGGDAPVQPNDPWTYHHGSEEPFLSWKHQQKRPVFDASHEQVEALLRRWLAFHTESAGMTPEIIGNKAVFKAFMEGIEAKKEALIRDTLSALHPQPPAQKQGESE